jgi:hypothetical protein
VTTTNTQFLFDEWIKGAGKDGEAKREKIAKELVDAQEADSNDLTERGIQRTSSLTQTPDPFPPAYW